MAAGLKDAASTIERDFASPAAKSATVLSQAFDRAFASMEASLGKAARTGEFSIRTMVDAMLRDMARLAFDRFVAQPVTGFLEDVVKGLFSFGGARAMGGPVSNSQAYLVGERGPELFVPAGAGRIDPLTARRGGTTIHFNITTPDAESFRRSESYITGQIARAVARGQRSL